MLSFLLPRTRLRVGRWRNTVSGCLTGLPRRSQYLPIRYTNRITQPGIRPSVGSVGNSYANAPAESVIGLHKTELIHRERLPTEHRPGRLVLNGVSLRCKYL